MQRLYSQREKQSSSTRQRDRETEKQRKKEANSGLNWIARQRRGPGNSSYCQSRLVGTTVALII